MSPHAYRGDRALGVSSFFTGIATVVVLLRLYTRFFIIRYNGIEDYLIALTMLCSIGLTACIGAQVDYGMGRHIEDIPGDELKKSLKAFWASLIVYYLSLGLTKSSIILQYQRIFTMKKFQITSWIIMASVIIYTIWSVFGSIFACVPVRAFWTQNEPAKCINQKAMWFTNAGFNILTDFAIILLPMPVIRSLQMGSRQKKVLLLIFGIGGFGCIVSILRLQSLVGISNSTDPTYENPPAATWSSVEVNVGIICSCLPCLRPLLVRSFPHIFSSGHGTGGPSDFANPYGRHTLEHGTRLEHVDSKHSRRSSDVTSRNIQVVTQIRVSVEDKDDGGSVDTRIKDLRGEIQPGSSTETLVRDVGKVV